MRTPGSRASSSPRGPASFVREIQGPAIVGEGSVIEDTVLGPNVSISSSCVVVSSKIEDSIVLEGTRAGSGP